MQENSEAIVSLMGDPSNTKELPAFQLMRIKREVMGKLYEVSDLAEVRRQRQEVEDMKRTLAMLQSNK
ncbi:hypothetical protein STCU_05115 [Strigomonas culicis]|nr:hypothetical protein STCU_05115 [Strigomonas culicis]|eukprot:EPY28465.1 hypothetical protein STCU_05115 [Strigomonas culicis]